MTYAEMVDSLKKIVAACPEDLSAVTVSRAAYEAYESGCMCATRDDDGRLRAERPFLMFRTIKVFCDDLKAILTVHSDPRDPYALTPRACGVLTDIQEPDIVFKGIYVPFDKP